MDLRHMMADEQARALLASAPAAGLLHGAVRVVEQDFRWVRPLRFVDEQIRALGSCQAWHPGLYRQMARTTAGICVEFETDATEVGLEVRVDAEPKGTRAVLDEIDRRQAGGPQPHDGLSAEVDGRALPCVMPEAAEGLVTFSFREFDADESQGLQALPGLARARRVRIWLPCLRGCTVRDVVCDGTYVRPVAKRRQLLVLGDSIAQGFVADDPALTWPVLLAGKLGLDVVNQGLGGQVFQPGSLYGLAAAVDPVRILVAYGENYRYEPCMARRVSRDIRSYLSELTRLWPQVPIHVLTPLWHDEEAVASHAMSCHEQIPTLLATHTAQYDQVTLVDGLDLLEHDPALLADAYEHPNARGCRQIATRMNAVIRVPGLRPSSVGKRRSRRKRKKAPTIDVPLMPETLQLPFDGWE